MKAKVRRYNNNNNKEDPATNERSLGDFVWCHYKEASAAAAVCCSRWDLYNIAARSPFSRSLPPAQIVWRSGRVKTSKGNTAERRQLSGRWNIQKRNYTAQHKSAFIIRQHSGILFSSVSALTDIETTSLCGSNIPAFNFFFFFSPSGCVVMTADRTCVIRQMICMDVRPAWSIHISLKKEKFFAEFFALDCRQNKFQFSSGAKRSIVRKNMC